MLLRDEQFFHMSTYELHRKRKFYGILIQENSVHPIIINTQFFKSLETSKRTWKKFNVVSRQKTNSQLAQVSK